VSSSSSAPSLKRKLKRKIQPNIKIQLRKFRFDMFIIIIFLNFDLWAENLPFFGRPYAETQLTQNTTSTKTLIVLIFKTLLKFLSFSRIAFIWNT
jgi:hypothetical protein